MHGLITPLPEPYKEKVYQLWEDFQKEHHLNGVFTTPIPHFTWHVDAQYRPELVPSLADFFANNVPPTITTDGLGIFCGEHPIIFINLLVTEELLRYHSQLFTLLQPFSAKSNAYYEPGKWHPHITLALGDTNPSLAGTIIKSVSDIDFNWTFECSALTLIQQNPQSLQYEVYQDFTR